MPLLRTGTSGASARLRPRERIHPDQLKALAVLHLLTGSPVAVVRVDVEGASAITSQMLSTEIAYRKQKARAGGLDLPKAAQKGFINSIVVLQILYEVTGNPHASPNCKAFRSSMAEPEHV